MGTPPAVAGALFAAALPICLYVAWTDMARLRIPNAAVLTLVALFAVVGLLLVPLPGWTLADWLWRWPNLLAVLAAGVALNAAGVMGAGDAKFLAAAAPYVAASDWMAVLWIAPAMMLAAFASHRLMLHTVGPRLAPDWLSWRSGKRFPMGLALGPMLLCALLLAALA